MNGYPQQLARLLKLTSFTDMSSSGATVEHVLCGGQWMLGPQIDALGPSTQLVTLTAGGNDVGFIGDITALAYQNSGGVVGSVLKLLWSGAKPMAQRNFATLDTNLQTTLREIAKRSPNAKVVVVTYPSILPARGTCPAIELTEEQASLLRAVENKLAETTRSAAASTGATVVDMAALSIGHDACSAEAWVNGFKPKSGADFHPTLAGAQATAKAIARVLGRVDGSS